MTKYQVNVKAPAEDRMAFIKALRTVAGISLKRAADLSVHFGRFRNSTLVAGLGKAAAEHIAETLIASGARVAVLESPLDTPMMCCPEADQKFKWGRLRTLVRLR
jgi:ribosomal protein L7/L12